MVQQDLAGIYMKNKINENAQVIKQNLQTGSILLAALLFLLSACQSAPTLKLFEENEKYGYKDLNGKIVLPARYALAENFSQEGIAAVADNTGWHYIDTKGKTLFHAFVYDNAPDSYSEGLARYINAKGQFGFNDLRGKIVIKARFSYARPFKEGLAAVCEGCRFVKVGEHSTIMGGSWGYVDKTGKVVIALRYHTAGDFEKGLARVKLNLEDGIPGNEMRINTKGTPQP